VEELVMVLTLHVHAVKVFKEEEFIGQGWKGLE